MDSSGRVTTITPSQRRWARIAGISYLASLALILYANFGLRRGLFVGTDMAGTVQRIAATERLFRLSVAVDFVYCAMLIVVLAAYYVVLSPVQRPLALLATVWRLLHVAASLLMALDFRTVIRLVADPGYAQAFGAQALQGQVRLHWVTTGDHYYAGLLFWSLSTLAFGVIWLRSRYIARAFAWIGIVSAAWCVFCTLAFVADPGFGSRVNVWLFDSPMVLFDIALSMWLLFAGLPRERGAAAA